METINKVNELGGNIELYIIPFNLVNPITGLNIDAIGTDPTLELKCTAESIKHTFKTVDTRAGTLYEHTVTAFVSGRSEANENILTRMMSYRHIVVFADSVGQYWRIGDHTEALKLDVEFDSADNPSNKNGYAITLTGQLISAAKRTNFPLI